MRQITIDASPLNAAGSSYLRLSVTDRCNLRCRYCTPGMAGTLRLARAPLDDQELAALVGHIHEVRPLGKVRLTGGEPLLRSGLVGLVERLAQAAPGAALALTTNGVRLPRLAAPLRAAGISRVNISVDTLDPTRFRGLTGGELGRVLRGVDAARRAGFPRLKLNAVLQRGINGDELARLVRFAAGVGAELRFIELMPMGPTLGLYLQEHLDADEALASLSRSFPHLGALEGRGIARRHRLLVDGVERVVGFITPVSHPFCGACNRLRLDAYGQLSPCLRRAEQHTLAGADRARVAEVLAGLRPGRVPEAASWPRRQMISIGG